MALLIGTNSIPAASFTSSAGTITAWQAEASAGGTLAAIHVRTGNGAMAGLTNVFVGIYADNAGSPGALLGTGELKAAPGKEEWFIISGFSVVLEAGKKYWLAALGIGGGLSLTGTTSGTATEKKSTKSTFTKLEETTEWKTALGKGPLGFYGESASVGTGKVSAGGDVAGSGGRQTSGVSKASAGARVTATGVAQLSQGPGAASAGARAAASGGRQTSGVGRVSAGAEAMGTGEQPPVLLIGRESEPESTPSSLGLATKKARLFRAIAKGTGIVTQLTFFAAATNNSKKLWLGIFADNAGEPGALLGEVTLSPSGETFPSETLITLAGLSVQITQGTAYWLGIMSEGTLKLKVTNPEKVAEHEPSRAANSTSTSLATIAGGYEADTGNAPLRFFGFGHPTAVGTARVNAGAETAAAGSRATSGIGAIHSAASATAEGEVTGGAKTKAKATAGARVTAQGSRATSGTGRASGGAEVAGEGSGTAVKRRNYYTGEPYVTKSPPISNASEPFCDLYPATTTGLAPLVCIVHGGGWSQGYIGEYAKGTEAAKQVVAGAVTKGKQQCAAVNIEYHLAEHTIAAFPQAVEDIVAAVEYAIANAAILHADPTKVFLLGGSAGGHLVAEAYKVLTERGFSIKGVVMLSGLPDMRLLCEECEQSIEPSQSGEPLFNASIEEEGGQALIKHVQEAVQACFPLTSTFISGAPLTTSPGSRTFQSEYSPTKLPIPGTGKWMIVSSFTEVVSRPQSENFQAHLEALGKWQPGRCSRILRTNATTASFPNGLEEIATGNEGKGHGFAYLDSTLWPKVLSFIFLTEGAGSVTAGARATPTTIRTAIGTGRVSAAAQVTGVGGHSLTGRVSAGARVTSTAGAQHLGEARVSAGAEVTAPGHRATGGIVNVTGAVRATAFGSTRLRARGTVTAGIEVQAEGEREIDRPLGTPAGGRVAVTHRGRMT